MKKKLLYVIALILLCSTGCCDVQEKDQQNKETKQNKATITDQAKKAKTTQKEKKERKNEDSDDTEKKEHQSPSSSEISPTKTEVAYVNQSGKDNIEAPSKPTNKPSNPPKQDIPETPPKEEVMNTPVKQSAMEAEVLNKINNYRAENGLQPLSGSQYYQEKANAHAYAMAEKRALWHEDNGECITNSPDPFTAWINSPEHRNIILTPNNTVGVVAIYYVDGYYYSVFRTYW
ncbi:hypothetical protein Aargi30884_17060 [Amedibacterium intestinale]|uniref:SCP domain-containing protein n=1 Tax=Amedibacterium intestinale TaxID=2583452 RepID=A0A6N4TJ38_9FIRM|nr:CAP domain-containing protein [Amedibacterium intestinale]BBK22803.1 hypothetical protein Aargi30884_17060 [Amedibacterium intestinale]